MLYEVITGKVVHAEEKRSLGEEIDEGRMDFDL